MRIKYFGYFDNVESSRNRMFVSSATNKMSYVICALNKVGYEVDVISCSYLLDKNFTIIGSEKKVNNKNTIFFFSSISGGSIFLKLIRHLWHLIALFFFLLIKVKKNEIIIVYHSLIYATVFNLIKKIKKINIILEVEEIYTDAVNYGFRHKLQKHKEFLAFKNASSYIFSTELLHTMINKNNKPFIISHGTYNVEPIIAPKFNDGKIHVVYAGTFDSRKNGANMAVRTAFYLTPNYFVHICGFGSPKDTQTIINLIEEVSSECECQLQYEGLLLGTDYIKLLQQCHIGLSTQDPIGVYNYSSFPSKVLSYMANGLSVVSSDLKVLRISKLGKYISFYKKRTPKYIAEAILNAYIVNDNRMVVRQLDEGFTGNLRMLLKEMV